MIRIPKSNSEIREAMSEGMDEQSVTTYFEGVVKRYIKEIAVMSELKVIRILWHVRTIRWKIMPAISDGIY